ncbi:hypothetical protein F4803DRAFT_539145 [Xylaria telfairii]|nr:hypothetical protein F4803DRAFT_539145 [Xylaria telfairii]
MGARKQATKATPRNHQQCMPPAAGNSTLYTSSYMTVQELSPPLSSPQPSLPTSSPEPIHELPVTPIPCRPRPSGPRARHEQETQSIASERPSGQSKETVLQDSNGSNRERTARSPVNCRAQPRASRPVPSYKKSMEQHTAKLVKVLVRNKALLCDCLAEGKDEDHGSCKAMMRKVSTAVEDRRFQSWSQVKSWMFRHHRKQKQMIKVPTSPSSSPRSSRISIPTKNKRRGGVPFGVAFEKHLTPILRTWEMTTNKQKLLDSVIEAIGSGKLTQAFRHRLARDDELPADIGPLIFSPLFLKICEKQVRRVKTAAPSRTDSDDSGSEWSDWEEDDDDEASDESCAVRAAGANALPSIEYDDGSENEPELMAGKRPDQLPTPVESQGPETRALAVRPSRKTRCKAERVARSARRIDGECVSRRCLQPPPCTNEDTTRQPVPGQAPVLDPVAGSARNRERESEFLYPPAPNIRPFADFATPAASEPPDPETRSIFRFGSILHHTNEQFNPASLNKDIIGRAINHAPQHVANPGSREKNKSTKQAAPEDPDKEPFTSSNQGVTPSISQAKGGPTPVPIPIPISKGVLPVRETPAILRAENQRQVRKLAKPLAPAKIPSRPAARKPNNPLATQRAQGEIRPPAFYGLETGETRGSNAEVKQSNTPARPARPPQHITKISKSRNEEKENKPGGNDTVARTIASRQSPSDDEASLPSLEEIYRPFLSARGRTAKRRTAQIQTEPDEIKAEPPAQRGKNNSKKRPMREPTEEHTTSFPAPASSRKRMKLLVNVTRPAIADSAQGLSVKDQAREQRRRQDNAQAASTCPQQQRLKDRSHNNVDNDSNININNMHTRQVKSRH